MDVQKVAITAPFDGSPVLVAVDATGNVGLKVLGIRNGVQLPTEESWAWLGGDACSVAVAASTAAGLAATYDTVALEATRSQVYWRGWRGSLWR